MIDFCGFTVVFGVDSNRDLVIYRCDVHVTGTDRMPRKFLRPLESPLSLAHAVAAGTAIMTAFGGGFVLLHGDISDFRHEVAADIAQIRGDVSDLRRSDIAQLHGELSDFRRQTEGDIAQIRGDLTESRVEMAGDIAQIRADLSATHQQVSALSVQQALANAKLDELISEQKRSRVER